jgi:FkbM family methyltransferase
MLEQLMGFLPRPARKLLSPAHRTFYNALRSWRRDVADDRRYEYPGLGPESIVLDLGGFKGEWSERIFSRYLPTIHIFEPHPEYAGRLTTKFAMNSKIHVHPFAFGSSEGAFQLSDMGAGSSQFRNSAKVVDCRSVEAGAFLRQHGIESIDLAKVNIEGGEYDVLPHLIAIGAMPKIDVLQIQFHLLDRESPAKRDAIRAALGASHSEVWCYPFVWEQWRRRAIES